MPIPLDDLMVLNRAATVARLLSGVAHDVNNSLLVISGTAELLEDGSGSLEARTRGMTRIRTQSAKAAAAIAEVLAFTRADTTLSTRVSLRETATSAVALRSYAISRAGLKIECSAPQDRTLVVVGNSPLL
jgi:signal transduction histidine kinase